MTDAFFAQEELLGQSIWEAFPDIAGTVFHQQDATPTQIDRLMAMGADAYLTKPINVRQFLHILSETLKKQTPDE
jgi:DNA-binding NarL/FixJ family response regulator